MIVASIGIVLLFRWAGVRGLIMFIFGMGVMAYLMIAKKDSLDYFENVIRGKHGIFGKK